MLVVNMSGPVEKAWVPQITALSAVVKKSAALPCQVDSITFDDITCRASEVTFKT